MISKPPQVTRFEVEEVEEHDGRQLAALVE
jgi:hypothetical protein